LGGGIANDIGTKFCIMKDYSWAIPMDSPIVSALFGSKFFLSKSSFTTSKALGFEQVKENLS
jgi:hypothetical protein